MEEITEVYCILVTLVVFTIWGLGIFAIRRWLIPSVPLTNTGVMILAVVVLTLGLLGWLTANWIVRDIVLKPLLDDLLYP